MRGATSAIVITRFKATATVYTASISSAGSGFVNITKRGYSASSHERALKIISPDNRKGSARHDCLTLSIAASAYHGVATMNLLAFSPHDW